MSDPNYLDMLNQQQQDERKQAQWGHIFPSWIPSEKINLPAYKSPLELINTQDLFTPSDEFNKSLKEFQSWKYIKTKKRWEQDYGKSKKLENQEFKPKNPADIKLDTSKLTLPTTQQLSAFQKGWQKVNKFMNSRGAQIGMQALGVGMNFLGDNDKDINSWDTATKQLRNGIADSMLSSGNPWLMAGALGIKGFGKLGAFGDSTKG